MTKERISKKIKISLRGFLGGIIGCFFLSTQPGTAQQQTAEQLRDVQEIVAIVNDSVISLFDLKQRVLLYIISSGSRQISAEQQQYINQQALQGLVDDKLKVQEAKKYDAVMSDADKNNAFADYASQFKLSPENFEQQLNKAGILKKSMLFQIEANLAWEQVVGGLLMPQVSISDDEIYSIIERIKSNKGQDEYHPREIFLLVAENSKREENRVAAHKIVEQLRKGAPFQTMAQQFSQSSTAAVGGDMGWVMKNGLWPELSNALKNMKKGEVSEPIESEDGFYILQLVEKRKVLTPSLLDTTVDLQHMFFEVSDKAQEEEIASLDQAVSKASAEIKSCENLAETGETLGAKDTGNLGTLKISDLPENLHDQLLSLEIGHATKALKEEKGFRVFVICDRKDPQVQEPDYDSIEQSLSQQRVGLMARRHLRDLRRDAIIDYR